MAKGIVKQVKTALQAANQEIKDLSHGGLYAKGLASEGFIGGYTEALQDVLLALNGVTPDRWARWANLNKTPEPPYCSHCRSYDCDGYCDCPN